jgi:hypothetical protein|nr:MAG TPA: hypothetical protein [Caudoviricetes sp.]
MEDQHILNMQLSIKEMRGKKIMAKTDFKVIDISMKITNQLPMIRITEDLVVTVNNRKNNILCVQAMASEAEKKVSEDGDNGIGFMVKALEMLVGKEAADKIEDMDLPLPEYKEMYNTIMSVATGTYGEEQTPSK